MTRHVAGALAAAALLADAAALIWTAIQHSGVHASDWYISSCLIGCGAVFAANAVVPLTAFPRWVYRVAIAAGVYILLQLIPLPAAVLRLIDPARAAMLNTVAHVLPAAHSAPIAVDQPAAILWAATLFAGATMFFTVRCFTAALGSQSYLALLPLFFISTVEALLGLLQLTTGAPFIIGTYNSRDHYSFLLEITVPLFAAAGLVFMRQGGSGVEFSFRRAGVTCLFWGFALLLIAAIFSSLSRTGAFGALVGVAVFVSLAVAPSLPSRTLRLGFASVLFLAIGFALFAFTPHALMQRLFQTAADEPDVRLQFWRESRPLLSRFPLFGIGLMGYESAFLQYQNVILLKRIDFAHNDYLQYLIELGAVGFTLAAVTLTGVLWPCLRGALRSSDHRSRIWLTGCAGAFAAVAVHSLVDFNLYVPANVLAFAWITGFASGTVSGRPVHSRLRA